MIVHVRCEACGQIAAHYNSKSGFARHLCHDCRWAFERFHVFKMSCFKFLQEEADPVKYDKRINS